MAHTNDRAGLAKPLTLAIDIGGSHLKAAVLNASGKMSTDPVRVKTPKPVSARTATISLNAASSGGISFACMTAGGYFSRRDRL